MAVKDGCFCTLFLCHDGWFSDGSNRKGATPDRTDQSKKDLSLNKVAPGPENA